MPFIQLSSRVTLLYKLIIPLGGLLSWSVYASLVVAQQWLWELHGVVLGFLLLLLALFTVMLSLPIRHVAYNEEFLRVRNYGPAQFLPSSEYLLFEPAYFLLTRLRLVGGRSYLFMGSFPGLLSRFVNHPGDVLNAQLEPASIDVARRTLAAVAQRTRNKQNPRAQTP
jgi:hypothetical protein